jgi:hypothetical protein
VVLRTALACVPVVTLGVLAWVPLIRLATLRRTVRDWLVCAAVAVLAGTCVVAAGAAPEDSGPSYAGVAGMLLLALFGPVYYLAAEIRWYRRNVAPRLQPPPYPAPPPVPYPPPVGRVDRVRAELDELSAYLRAQEER